jgi:hypothetical protein
VLFYEGDSHPGAGDFAAYAWGALFGGLAINERDMNALGERTAPDVRRLPVLLLDVFRDVFESKGIEFRDRRSH